MGASVVEVEFCILIVIIINRYRVYISSSCLFYWVPTLEVHIYRSWYYSWRVGNHIFGLGNWAAFPAFDFLVCIPSVRRVLPCRCCHEVYHRGHYFLSFIVCPQLLRRFLCLNSGPFVFILVSLFSFFRLLIRCPVSVAKLWSVWIGIPDLWRFRGAFRNGRGVIARPSLPLLLRHRRRRVPCT